MSPRQRHSGGTSRGTDKTVLYHILSEDVPHVPRVPHENNDAALRTDLIEAFEERAAIMEYDGGLSRKAAEAAAWTDIYGDRISPR